MECAIESKCSNFYPILLEPNLHTIVWGGTRLKQWKKLSDLKDSPNSIHIGESWEVSAIPSSPSIISNGAWAGYSLAEIIARYPSAILGNAVAKKYNNTLPLLVKFIDAQKDLSIQVHPNDEIALREHNKRGKTEMWYILDAAPGACIYVGFNTKLTLDEYKKRVAEGTITEVLARHEVHTGDVFYLPAGRIHAICSGVLLAEVQQASDITYRIFDYHRLDFNGQPRELHIDLAAKALNFEVLNDYRTSYCKQVNRPNKIIESPLFSVRTLELTSNYHRNMIKYDSFIIVMCLQGSTKISIRSTHDEITIHEGYSCIIPATIADYDYIPLEKRCKVLESYINNKKASWGAKIVRFFHITKCC